MTEFEVVLPLSVSIGGQVIEATLPVRISVELGPATSARVPAVPVSDEAPNPDDDPGAWLMWLQAKFGFAPDPEKAQLYREGQRTFEQLWDDMVERNGGVEPER